MGRGVTRFLRARRQRHENKKVAASFTIVIIHGLLNSEATASSASMLGTPLMGVH